MSTRSIFLASQNALFLIAVTVGGIVMEVNPSQSKKAFSPIFVTDVRSIEVNPSQKAKAFSPMVFTEAGTV